MPNLIAVLNKITKLGPDTALSFAAHCRIGALMDKENEVAVIFLLLVKHLTHCPMKVWSEYSFIRILREPLAPTLETV